MSKLFDFRAVRHGGLDWYVVVAADSDIPEARWPGLVAGEYSDDHESNPFWRYGVNNADGEMFALWRAMAWVICDAPVRAVVPRYDRDHVAEFLGRAREGLSFVEWEYEVDYEVDHFESANRGFVAARSAIPIRPEPSEWEIAHQHLAGLFPIESLAELHLLDAAISFDVASEMSIFGVERTVPELQGLLSGASPPSLPDVLGSTGVMAHVTLVRDRFLGFHSYLAFAANRDLSARLTGLVSSASTQWAQYLAEAPSLSGFDDFAAAMDRLLNLD